jgi:hypothetical protein
MIAGIGLAAGTLALAQQDTGRLSDDGIKKELSPAQIKRGTRAARGDTPARPVGQVGERRESRRSEASTKPSSAKRIKLTPSVDAEQSPKPFPHIGAGVPGLKPQKQVTIPRDLALEFDPVGGVGFMMDQTMTPRLFSVAPAQASSGWVGSLIEDPYSSVFFLETSYGLCGWVSSSKFGSFRMLPGESRESVVLNSQNVDEVARCGGMVKDFVGNATVRLKHMMGSSVSDMESADVGELAAAALGGAPPQCWAPGSTASTPDSSSYFVRYNNRSCNSGPFVVDDEGTPDLPDESIRRYGFPCNGESTVVKPWFDFIVDILYGYSAEVLGPEYAGNINTIRARAAFEAAQMNEILFRSRMRVKVRVVGVKLATTLDASGNLVGYQGSGNPVLDLEVLGSIGGSFTQGADNLVLEERDVSGADLVAMMVGRNNNPNVGGIAGGGVCVLTWGNGTTTFAHEVGHLFGAGHASESSEPDGDLDSDCGEYALCDPMSGEGRVPASNAAIQPPPDCVWEDFDEYIDCYTEEVCDPDTTVNDTPFFTGGSPPVIVYPEEYAYGWRGEVDGGNGATNITTTMAYPVDGSFEVLNYSTPEVTFPSTFEAPFDGVTGNVSCRFCASDGNTAANAWIMHENLLNLVDNAEWSANGGVPIYLDADGVNHFPSASSVVSPGQATDGLLRGRGYPPNYGVILGIGELELTDADTCIPFERNGQFFGREEILPTPENGFQGSPLIRPWVQVFQRGPGIAQLRCRTIPYDCNQNGLLDTEELDGTAFGGNSALLTDFNRDRVPDGCWPRECSDSPSVFNAEEDAVITFTPAVQQDPNDPAVMRGSGGVISDFTYTESILTGPPAPGDADDIYWFFQPSEIRIDNLVHPRLSDLTIELVRRQIGTGDLAPQDNPTETVWQVFRCGPSETQALSGTYIFQVSGGEEDAPNAASTALRFRSACAVVQSGEYGYILPSGRFNFGNFEIGAAGVPFSGEWLLRITDDANGSTGFFSAWSMKCKVLPYDEDCNADGVPDTCGDAFAFDTDCNLDNIADSCQIASEPLLDCDSNGVIDTCEDSTFLVDLGGGLWDADGDGAIDEINDTFYIQTTLQTPFFDPNLPCDQFNPNGRSDLCDVIQGQLDAADEYPDLDVNNNLFLDCFETDEVFCATRIFNTRDPQRASGPGTVIADFGMTTSTITISAEGENCFGNATDDALPDPCVTSGSLVLAGIELRLNDFQHDAPEALDLRLIHVEPNGTTVIAELLPFGCPVSGYFKPGTNTYVFNDLGQQTMCSALQQSVQLPDGEDEPYRASGSDFGSLFINRPIEGTWRLEFLDPIIGDSGTLGSWDLKMNFRPPDNNGDGVPDVCEE